MLLLPSRRGRRLRVAALAAAVGACASGMATTACTDRLTTLGSLTLSVAPTALRVVAGRADSVTVRVLRGGGFAGTVGLSVVAPASAPAGLAVTLDAAALAFPHDVSLVRVASAAGTPPGTYVYDVQAVGEGGAMTASRSVAVTVDAVAR
ncbi:hypothetical protein [Roseisolibacter agri]|uniref:Uncharacterized protein n=1 Tax=Roseisolibacter agri TaxID=2014610 RepID=A0AA37Q2U7_9BACT|nr:hypothetical protein [Roseisolibacter agri]GLC25564.1 hypothetical protein rosag_20770 [Roseisolibacter agri]